MTTVGTDMRVNIAGVEFTNPVIAASGTFGYGTEFEDVVALERVGGLVTKGVSPEPMLGNSAPRLIETTAGMMNAIGLQNMGVQALIAEKLPELRRIAARTKTRIIVNLYGYSIEDYLAVVRALNAAEGIDLYELNASCPNTKEGGAQFGMDSSMLRQLVSAVKQEAKRPVMVKLSPNVTSIAHMAWTAEDAGADAISLVNTFLAMAIDVETRRPRIANVTGGLSGPGIKPIAVRMVHEASRVVKIPVVGMGGILTAADAVEFMLAGATAVQVGTASFADPRAVEKIATGLKRWCTDHAVARVAELTGGMQKS